MTLSTPIAAVRSAEADLARVRSNTRLEKKVLKHRLEAALTPGRIVSTGFLLGLIAGLPRQGSMLSAMAPRLVGATTQAIVTALTASAAASTAAVHAIEQDVA